MAIVSGQVTVSTVAVALTAVETDTISGGRVYVRNADAANTVALGGSGVTAGTGYLLPPLASITVEVVGGEQLFGIRAGASDVVAVSVLRIGA